MEYSYKLNYHLVNTKSGLEDVVTAYEKENVIAVDLEADSMYHFNEKVCLIQLATKKANVVIDPLKIKDLSPLKPIFWSKDIKKVFHGADYDVRSLYRDFNIEINNIFDTQLACMFLGLKETGLEAVLKKRFNVTLDKKFQKKDWSQRPLPEDMIEYAAMDTVYLILLAEIFEKKLEEKGRILWVSEECEYLSKVRSDSNNEKPLYLKFKGAGHLNPKSLAVLESLLKLRLSIAKKKDKPLYKIIGNGSIMKITLSKPSDLRKLKNTHSLTKKQINIYGDALIEAVDQALKIPSESLPVYPKKKMPLLEPAVPKRLKALKEWRETMAQKLNITPGFVCNNALLNSLAIRNPSCIKDLALITGMRHWREQEFGKELIEVLKYAAGQ